MEELGLLYSVPHNIIICQECGFALLCPTIQRHLQRYHNYKGPRLQEVMVEVYSKSPAVRREDVVTPPDGLAPVTGLEITPGFQCNVLGCNLEAGGRSQNYRTIVRHMKKEHQLPQGNDSMIKNVGLQSFFPAPNKKLFSVVLPGSRTTSTTHPSSTVGSSQGFLQHLELEYKESDAVQQATFSTYAIQSELYASQIPPWLQTTGISNFLGRLQLNKPVLHALVQPPAALTTEQAPTVELLIYQCVYERLFLVRNRSFAGHSSKSINRPTARILNSFDPARSETKPFVGVQEITTLQRYSGNWARLLLFLVRIAENKEYSNICANVLPHQSSLRMKVDAVVSAAISLQVINVDRLEYKDCYQIAPSSPLNSGDSSADEAAAEKVATLIAHAAALSNAVFCLSSELTMVELPRDSFSSPVVAYSAIRTLSPTGAWKSSHEFSPFLSSMIHCMQLWILCQCLDEEEDMQKWEASPSLFSLVKDKCSSFLVNTSSSPIAELSYWRLLTRSVGNDSVWHPATTLNNDCTRVSHMQIDLSLDCWRSALQNVIRQASDILDSNLLLGLEEVPLFPLTFLHDSPSNHSPGQSFLDDPRNNLGEMRDWLFARLRLSTELQGRFFHIGSSSSRSKSSELCPKQLVFRSYLHSNKLFLQNLAFLMYMTAGLPPRRKELTGLTWRNHEAPRNIYIQAGSVVLVTSYHKSQWRVGTRPIARFLPSVVGELLVRYLIYVPRFLQFLYKALDVPPAGANLFCEGATVWTPEIMGSIIQRQTRGQLGIPITTRQWRHIAIALDRRLLQGSGSSIMGLSETWGQQTSNLVGSDSEVDAPTIAGFEGGMASADNRIHHLQAAHTSKTNTAVYGNSLSLQNGLTDTLLASFRKVSSSWHELAGMTANNSSKRRHSIEDEITHKKAMVSVSPLAVRKELWTLPALLKSFQNLLGPSAIMRPHQQTVLREIANCIPEMMVILPTGGGKTLLYIIPSLLPGAQVTAVVIPLVALKQDLLRRCSEWNIEATSYDQSICATNRLHATSPLLFIDVDCAATDHCRAFLRALLDNGRLDRIVLDEAHLILTASHYREQLGKLGYLRTLACPFICLTATLPPSAESDLRKVLHLPHSKVFRSHSGRNNLRYSIELVHPAPNGESREDAIVQKAVTICNTRSSLWRSTKSAARGLCFVRSKSIGSILAESLGCHFYHAGLEPAIKEELLKDWSRGEKSVLLVTTSALSAGLDYTSVYLVLHLDAPSGMVDYAQETGRGGRDGQPAECIIIIAPRWTISWESSYCSDFLLLDRQHMEQYLQTKNCLRASLSAYLDDENDKNFAVTCSGLLNAEICSVCAVNHFDQRICIRRDSNIPETFGSSPLLPSHALYGSDSSSFTATSQLQSNPTQFGQHEDVFVADRLLSKPLNAASQLLSQDRKSIKHDVALLAADPHTPSPLLSAIPPTASLPSALLSSSSFSKATAQRSRLSLTSDSSSLMFPVLAVSGSLPGGVTPSHQIRKKAVQDSSALSSQSLRPDSPLKTKSVKPDSPLKTTESVSRSRRREVKTPDLLSSSSHAISSTFGQEQPSHLSSSTQRLAHIAAFSLPAPVFKTPQVVASRSGSPLRDIPSSSILKGNITPLAQQAPSKTAWRAHYPTQSLHKFIIDSEEDPIISSSLTPALDQTKSYRADEIDKSDWGSSIDFQDHATPPKRSKRPGYLLSANTRPRTPSTPLSRHKVSCMLPPPLYQEVGSSDGRELKLDYYDMEESAYPKSGRLTRRISELQSPNKQAVALLDRPKQAGLLVTGDGNTGKSEEDSYRAAASAVLDAEKSAELGLQCFERRVTEWGAACIPCSFHQCKQIEGTHANCIKESYSHMIDKFRTSIKFDRFIGCFRCGLPEFICSQRGKTGCRQAQLLYHACWTALCLDTQYAPQLLQLLGGPPGEKLSPANPIPTLVIRWLGKKQRIGGKEGCKASYLLYHWLDRLENRCDKGGNQL